ncbi:hypothetical protein [Rubinisphaera margarita]|uniref:hypothetical protein n=1 Tax=Rubinisphaera margarita TaxID=2909586 RepID=UPI001EE870C3|nr:hypothetical protein [Rubinisphaera margarita]MCG6157183.1 hypothetical protein [Rubinisphaera margarita]
MSLLLLLAVLISGAPIAAQPPATPETSPPTPMPATQPAPAPDTTAATSPPLPQTDRVPQDIVYMPNEEGKPIAVPLNVVLEQYLDWLDRKELAAGENQFWVLRSLSATAKLNRDAEERLWADIRFDLDFNVDRSPEWNSLPLMMGESVLTGFSQVQENAEAPSDGQLMVSRDIDSGQWLLWYRNLETFRIDLQMLTPIRSVSNENQLLLTVPQASRTEMEVQLDLENPAIELNSRGFWERDANDGGVLVRIAGFQQQIDLTWSESSIDMSIDPIVDVDSRVEVLRQGDSTSITARQAVTIERGAITTLNVKLPSGFQPDSITSDRDMKYIFDPTDPSSIQLNFSPPLQTTAQINWKLSAPVRRFESQILIDGFKVERARKETGKVALRKSPDWRMTQITTQSENIFATDVRDLTFAPDAVQAFRYYSQPFQLALSVQRAKTTFSADGYFNLLVQDHQLDLSGEFVITPRNGVIDAISLTWKNFDSDGWELSTVTADEVPLDVVFERADQLVIKTPSWTTQHRIRFKARRPRNASAQKTDSGPPAIDFSLPVIASTNTDFQDQILRIVSLRPDRQPRLTGDGFVPLSEQRIGVLKRQASLFDVAGTKSQQLAWYSMLETDEPRTLAFDVVDRSVACRESQILTRIDLSTNTASIDHVFDFDVETIPVDEFRFQLSTTGTETTAAKSVRFFDQAGEELKMISQPIAATATAEGVPPVTRVGFIYQSREAIRGKLRIRARMTVPLQIVDGDVVRGSFPRLIAQPSDRSRHEVINQTPYNVSLQGEGWQLEDSGNYATSFVNLDSEGARDFQVDLTQTRTGLDVGYVDARVETWVASDGTTVTNMLFRIARTPPSLHFDQMEGAEILSLVGSLDGRADSYFRDPIENSRGTSFLLPDNAVGLPGRLVISIRHPSETGLTSLKQQALSLPSHSLRDHIGLMTWDLLFPSGVYLFQPPDNMLSTYRWEWRGFGFRRIAQEPFGLDREQANLRDANGKFSRYRFTSHGWPETMEFRSIGRGLLITIGCGLPLLFAIVLLGRSATSQLQLLVGLIVLAITFAALLPEPALVLAQPLLLGMISIGIATWGAYHLRSRQEEPTLIIVGPHHESGSKSEGAIQMDAHGVGADDITRIQPHREFAESSQH